MNLLKPLKVLEMISLANIFHKKDNAPAGTFKNIKIDINNLPTSQDVPVEQKKKIYRVINRAFQEASK